MEWNVEKYINRIRNQKKKTYAQEYLEWLRVGDDDAPDPPEGLSYMAAQAVRMNVYEEENHGITTT